MYIEAMDCSRENEVQIVCLPLHSTYKLQLMGVSFIQLLKTYHEQEIEIWPEKPSKESCFTLSNYWVDWESLLEVGYSSFC
jgi:hypothetical protein